MKALVIGATGATGTDLVKQLLEDGTFTEVHVFVRRNIPFNHGKLTGHVVDFDRPAEWEHLVSGDVAFSCLGTTLRAAGGKAAQWKVDHDYQYEFARAAAANGTAGYVLVSSAGADPGSMFFYLKMKGQLEEEVERLGFQSTVIFQPGPLERPDTHRFGERASVVIIKFFNQLGLFKSQRPLSTAALAKAMILKAKAAVPGVHRVRTSDVLK